MKLVPQSSPYIRKPVSIARMMMDVIIALLPVTVFAIIQNGWNAIYVILLSLTVMLLSEIIAHAIIKWPKGLKFKQFFTKDGFKQIKESYTINNFLAPIISALIYALILPAGVSVYVVITGAIFGMVIGKMVFGGLGNNIFNPAAVGRIFVAICFGSKLGQAYPSQGTYNVTAGATPLGLVKGDLGNMTGYSVLDAFLGNVPGSMGEVCVICILAGGLYLFIRRSADIRAFLGYIGSFAVLAFFAALSYVVKFNKGNIGEIFAYQLFTGGVMFAAVFMITDPVTSPTSKFGRVAFGVIAGSVTALIRFCGSYPEGAAFSILIANLCAPCIDHFMRKAPNKYTWQECLGVVVYLAILSMVVSATVVGGWF